MRSATESLVTAVRTDAQDERAWLERIARRDRDAMQKLYFAYYRRLSRFLTRMLPPEQADEVVNDTMFVVWRSAADFRGDSRVSTWVFGIAYRLALKRLKRDRSRSATHVDVFDSEDPRLSDDAGAARREIREWIDRALDVLPPTQRLAIELTYFVGCSCEEIATIADCPVNTVKTRLFHARERLRTLLPGLADVLPPDPKETQT